MELHCMDTVVGLLKKGTDSICNICKCCFDAQVDPTTGLCSNYVQIRNHIEHAEQCLKKSEMMIKEKLEYLNKSLEQLIEKEGNAEQQNKEKSMAKNNLHIEKESAEELLKYSKAALEQAKKVVASTQDEIQRQRDRHNTGVGVTTAGAALAVIPILGWIPGIIMMSVGTSEIVKASNAIRDAEDKLKKLETQVNENSKKVSDYQSKICNIQTEIEETDKLLNKIQEEVEEVKQNLKVTAEIQEMMRKSVNLLTVLSGRVTVIERQTQNFILWESVIKAMKDVTKALESVAENQLLCSQCLPGLINTFNENVVEILVLCNSADNSEYDNYY